jgi:hypothetical protein
METLSYCNQCKVWMNNLNSKFHCNTCELCLNLRHVEHTCRPVTQNDECPICTERLRYIPPPPHKIHRECLRSLINSGTKTCPHCRAPINNSNDRFGFQEEVDDECIVNNSLSASHSITKLVNDMELLGFNTIAFTKPTLRRYNLRERIDEL